MTKESILNIISNMDTIHLKAIEEYLEHQMYPDDDDIKIKDKKYVIYHNYSTIIAELIAKIEVYLHDMPKQISGLIETTFRILSSASVEKNEENELTLYDYAFKYEMFLINVLYLMLVDTYIREIKKYIKTLKKFNYRAIEVRDGILFMEEVNTNLKQVLVSYKRGKKKFKQIYDVGLWGYMMILNKVPCLNKNFRVEENVVFRNSDTLTELYDAFSNAEKVMELCEENYSNIINNGYNSTPLKRFLNIVPTIVTITLTILAAIVIYKEWLV